MTQPAVRRPGSPTPAGVGPPARPALLAMLEARSVALVGASPRPGSFGRRLTEEVARSASGPRLYPVNPKYAEVDGLRCYASLAELPEPPEIDRLRGEAPESGCEDHQKQNDGERIRRMTEVHREALQKRHLDQHEGKADDGEVRQARHKHATRHGWTAGNHQRPPDDRQHEDAGDRCQRQQRPRGAQIPAHDTAAR